MLLEYHHAEQCYEYHSSACPYSVGYAHGHGAHREVEEVERGEVCGDGCHRRP